MNSIRNRLLLVLVLGTIAVLIIGGFGLHLLVRRSLIHQQNQFLESRAQSITMLVTFEDGQVEFENDDDLSEIAKDIVFSIEDVDGHILKQSSILDGQALSPWKSMSPPKVGTTHSTEMELLGDQDWRALSRVVTPRVDHEDEQAALNPVNPPQLVVTIASSSRPIERALTVLLSAMIAVGLAVIGTICIVLWFGIRSALSPLNQLGDALSHTDAQSLDAIEPPKRCPNELKPIYRELNRLMDRIRSTLHWERLFTDAASHELRTPLAELQSLTEVAQRWPEGDRPLKALGEAHEIGQEMQQMVESLLNMTRARNNGNRSHKPTLIQPIIDQIFAKKHDMIEKNQLSFEATIASDAVFNASPEAIKLIFGNLIENAVSHTPAGGTITVVSRLTGENSMVLIKNGPVNLAVDDLEHMTRPFWRKDEARSDRVHVGLGLSVVQRMCDATGLRLELNLDESSRILSILITSPVEIKAGYSK